MLRRLLLLLCVYASLSGCAAVSGFPAPVFGTREEEAELKLYLRAASVENYEQCSDKFLCRNAIVDARVRAIDIAFYRFQRRLYRQESGASMGTNMLSMAMDSIAAVTATRGFAAGAGLLTGGRDAYSRQAMSVSMPLLLQEMAANRREILVRIRTGMAMPVEAYSLIDALGDLDEYELSGSIPAAAAHLAANAGSQTRVADEKLAALRAAMLVRAQTQSGAMPTTATVAVATPGVAPAPSGATVAGVVAAAGPPSSTGPSSLAVPAPSRPGLSVASASTSAPTPLAASTAGTATARPPGPAVMPATAPSAPSAPPPPLY